MTVIYNLTSIRRRALYDEADRLLDEAAEHDEYAACCRDRARRYEAMANEMGG